MARKDEGGGTSEEESLEEVMTGVLRTWARVSEPMDRNTYLAHGLGLALLKYLGDAVIVWIATGALWTPFDYLTAVSLLRDIPVRRLEVLGLAVWALPFIWLGVTLSMRRAVDAGVSPWLSFLFFIPYANYAMIALLLLLPSGQSASPDAPRPLAPEASIWPHYVAAISTGIAIGLAMFLVFVFGLASYSGMLFFATPSLMGAATAFVLSRRIEARDDQTVAAIVLLVTVASGVLLLLAAEGLVCIVMAAPLAMVLGLMGAALGRVLAQFKGGLAGALVPLIAMPLAGVMEPPRGASPVAEVQSSIEIDAPPEEVWKQVIAFRPIDPPRELLFRSGIAFPVRARIEGQGVGAIRYCEFSTGPFVEPITVWEPGRRLSFDVTASPAPLRELSPYGSITPPHIDGYMKSVRGEFRLVPLAGGRTRLEGSTWYTVDMGPQAYWRIWSNFVIHRIHMRVLDHIQAETERNLAMMRSP